MEINGNLYCDMARSAAASLENNKEDINALNVFPVPDGDTGVNMALTMSGVLDGLTHNGTLYDCAEKVAITLLRGARGNSGVILSLFFRGLAKQFKGNETADLELIAKAFENGTKAAYGAVMEPKEGTILTVMKAASRSAREYVDSGNDDVMGLFEYMRNAAQDMLEKTPEMLPVLKQANVVDAGGCGFMAVMDGFIMALKGTPITTVERVAPKKTQARADFAGFSTEDIVNPYCTECIVTKSDEFKGEDTCEAFHKFVMGMGDSVVFVDDEEIIKVHVHTQDPGRVLSEAVKYGSLFTVKIENMKNQHTNLTVGENEQATESAEEVVYAAPENKYGFVSVCAGEGLREVFTDLGVDNIVYGGQTMNPSIDDLIHAIERTPAENVFVLPNNSNIILVAKQCMSLVKDKHVEVIETKTVPQGVSAMLSFDPDAELTENISNMKESIKAVRTFSVTYAAHDSTFDGRDIKENQILGLTEGKLSYVTETRTECLDEISKVVNDAEIVTIYFGEDVDDEEKKETEALFTNALPGAEIVTVEGGQPVYSYLISAE